MTDLKNFTAALRGNVGPDAFPSLASTATALAGADNNPAVCLFANMLLMRVASVIDGDPLSEEDWISVRSILLAIADAIDQPNLASMNQAATVYLHWRRPSALH